MLQESACVAGTIQIGQAAKLTALSIDAIRLYERRALLPTVPRTPGRFRLYTPMTFPVDLIKQMQGVGFSLQEIKRLLDLRERRERVPGGQGTAEDETGQGPRHRSGAARIRTRVALILKSAIEN